MEQKNIRNFAIIAHVDHGKSTLADRFLEITNTIDKDKMQEQFLDQNPISRERGITIKLAPVRMEYQISNIKSQISNKSQNSNTQNELENARPERDRGGNWKLENSSSKYILNLIDTPGHVDFSYEVSRTLAACDGAILLVDATQGIQAQTLAHGLSALDQNLVLIPVINKIDMSNANIDGTKKQLGDAFGFGEDEILLVSAKTGQGVEALLEKIIEKVPPPKVDPSSQSSSGLRALRALVFDSFFDPFKGVVAEVRIVNGVTPPVNTPIYFLQTKAVGHILETGFFAPELTVNNGLQAGEIGYIATGIKTPDVVHVGDTIATDSTQIALPGYMEVKPMVFVGLYPIDSSEYFDLKDALAKFTLTDPAFSYIPEQSQALGAGFRCGFLGLLHAEVVQERLSGEFGVDLMSTAPSVEYMLGGKPITSPSDLPQGENIDNLKEPWVTLKIFSPQTYIGSIMELLQEKRGKFLDMQHFGLQVELAYELPLSEMVTDFYDKLKSVSSGFASLDYAFLEFRSVDAVRVDILVGGEKVDALSTIVHRPRAESFGRKMAGKLKEVLPRHNFEIAIQATIGGKIIARETLSGFRKDVLKKMSGGDVTRKNKLLEKQKKGKKKMKMVGRVQIPQEAFLSILKS